MEEEHEIKQEAIKGQGFFDRIKEKFTSKKEKPPAKTLEEILSEKIKKAKLNPKNNEHMEAKRQFLKDNAGNTKEGIFKYASSRDRSLEIQNPNEKGKFGDGFLNFNLKSKEYLAKDFTFSKAAGVTIAAINPINYSTHTDIMNGLGLLTKKQKQHEIINKSYSNRLLTSGLGLKFLQDGLSSGVDPISSSIAFGVSNAMIFGGLRVGEGVGSMVSTAFKSNKLKSLSVNAGRLAGLTGGVGLMLASGVNEILETFTNSDNIYSEKGNNLHKDAQYASIFQSQETLTARQAALSKLSKAGLNDRALILGNEALLYKSIM